MNQLSLKSAEFWVGLGLVAGGAACVKSAQDIFQPMLVLDALGPKTYPLVLGAFLALLGAIIALRAALLGAHPADAGTPSIFLIVLALSAVYIVAFEPVGYLLSTILYLAALFHYLGERRLWLTAMLSIGSAVALYYGFASLLNVRLPQGILGF